MARKYNRCIVLVSEYYEWSHVGSEKFCCTVPINNDIFPELHWHPPDLLRFAIQQYHGLVCEAQILIGLEERIQITEYTFAGSSYESKSGNKKHNEHKSY